MEAWPKQCKRLLYIISAHTRCCELCVFFRVAFGCFCFWFWSCWHNLKYLNKEPKSRESLDIPYVISIASSSHPSSSTCHLPSPGGVKFHVTSSPRWCQVSCYLLPPVVSNFMLPFPPGGKNIKKQYKTVLQDSMVGNSRPHPTSPATAEASAPGNEQQAAGG